MTSLTKPVKLVLFLDSWSQPRWVDFMLRDIVDRSIAGIAGVVINASPEQHQAHSNRFVRLARNWRALPYGLFIRFDQRSLQDDPFQLVSLENLCAGVPKRIVNPRKTAFSDYLHEGDLQWLRDLEPDVGLRLGFRILRGEVLTIPKHGVWSFHHGDNRHYRGGPAGFWEVVEGAPATGAILQRLTEDLDGGEILYRTTVPTHATSVSLNRATLYWAAARGLAAALRRAQMGNLVPLPESRLIPYSSRMYGAPQPIQAFSAIARLNIRRVTRRLKATRGRPQWYVGYRFNRLRTECDPPELSPHRLSVLPSPKGSLWADPFVVQDGDRHWIFFEEIPFGEHLGRISVVEIDPKGKAGTPTTVLSCAHHLSYPCIFKYNSAWYMIPESFDAGFIQLFKATRFPFQWEPVTKLFDRDPLVDPTVFQHGSKWWMFGSRPTPKTLVGEELYLYFSDHPLGDWQPHPMNPLRAGVDGSRPAGQPFHASGMLIRPGQLGAPDYGSGVMLFEIATLTTDQYCERPIGEIIPKWDPSAVGFHTLNAAGKVTVGDILLHRRT